MGSHEELDRHVPVQERGNEAIKIQRSEGY